MKKRWLPYVLVFMSNFSILLLELAATRLIARHVGSSLETWTAIIGILLAGVALGNFLGGKMADRLAPAKASAAMLLLSSILCVSVLPMNEVAYKLAVLSLPWSFRVCLVVGIVLIPPSLALGTISPMATKLALRGQGGVGRAVGGIYAAGALGSILGVYLTGFVFFSLFPVQYVVIASSCALAFSSLVAFIVGHVNASA